jgi:hypothetical protein
MAQIEQREVMANLDCLGAAILGVLALLRCRAAMCSSHSEGYPYAYPYPAPPAIL